MNTLDPMVSALIALCKSEGGEKFVADKAKVSAENLSQIIKGVKLPSGNPRGVGPGLRAKISAAYPAWLSTATTSHLSAPSGLLTSTGSSSNHHPAKSRQALAATDIESAVNLIADALMRFDPLARAGAVGNLESLCKAPERADLRRQLCTALSPPAPQDMPETGAQRAA